MNRRRFIILGSAGSVAVLTGCGGSGGGGARDASDGHGTAARKPAGGESAAGGPVVATDGGPTPHRPRATRRTPVRRRASSAATLVAAAREQVDAARHINRVLDVQLARAWTAHRRLRRRHGSHSPGEPAVAADDRALARLAGAAGRRMATPWTRWRQARARLYEFTLPVGSAGTYWYHPHPHELTAEQVFRGMAGLFIVRSRTDPVPAAIEEKLLVVSDLRLAADGTIPSNTAMDWQNGREGNYVLVNGQYQPVLTINPGQSQRWRILNATNARYLRLALTGHTMTLIGTDGGLLRSPVPGLDDILLAPAERVDVIVTASLSVSASAVLQTLPYDRGSMGMMGSSSSTIPLLTLNYTSAATTAVALPSALNSIADLGVPTKTKRLVFSSGMGMGGMGGGMMSFLIDGKSFDPARIDLTSRVNEVEQWTIENRSSMDHPFHLHGTQFQVVSRTHGGVRWQSRILRGATPSTSRRSRRWSSRWSSVNSASACITATFSNTRARG